MSERSTRPHRTRAARDRSDQGVELWKRASTRQVRWPRRWRLRAASLEATRTILRTRFESQADRALRLWDRARRTPARALLVRVLGSLLAVYLLGLAVLSLGARLSGRVEMWRESYATLPLALPGLVVVLLILCGIAAHLGLLGTRRLSYAGLVAALAFVAALWASRFAQTYAAAGLFSGLGLDFGLYYAQAAVLVASPSRLYDLSALGNALGALSPYSRSEVGGLIASPVPYPPVFAWIISLFHGRGRSRDWCSGRA